MCVCVCVCVCVLLYTVTTTKCIHSCTAGVYQYMGPWYLFPVHLLHQFQYVCLHSVFSIPSHPSILPPTPTPHPQVLQLMKGVGVGDVQKITLEKVTGDILVELNEDELESELGITKRIAQLKLMKVINGSKPVTDYIQEQEFKSMDIVC